ncbi:MAG: PepSY-like domain-containing protein [Pedobacter sp.]|nr:PepSY-like domain-containing protein [Chitinophagaceae bacterium]
MKRLLFVTFVIVSLKVSAQKIDAAKVPTTVKTTFTKAYPKVTAKWEMEDKNYEAAFKLDGKNITVVIDAKGVLLETETDIKINELPKAATDYLSIHYKSKKIAETAMIKKANGEINYEAEVNKVDVIFDSKGNFLKEVKG